MIARTVKEWIGKNPDQPFPPRVRLRILLRFDRHCARCTRPIAVGETFTADHVIAIVNGGENRERNGQPLCTTCNPIKNAEDMADKSKGARVMKRAYGISQKRGRPIPGSRRSGWRKPMYGPAVRRHNQ